MTHDPQTTETIIVAPYWGPGEGYGGGTKVATMEEARAEAERLAEQGYHRGKSRVHIVKTVRTVIEWSPSE